MSTDEKTPFMIVVEFLNQNEGAMSVLLSLLSLAVAVVAVWISLRSARQQVNMQLFDERYQVYRRLISLMTICNVLTIESLTLKGQKMLWNSSGWNSRSEQSEKGKKLIVLEETLSRLEVGSTQYEKVEAERDSLANEKFLLDVEEARGHHEILIKSKTLFSEEISKHVVKFLDAYEDVVFHVNHSEDTEVAAVFGKLNDAYKKIVSEKVVEKMEKYLKIGKKR